MARAKGQLNSATLELEAAILRTGESETLVRALAIVAADPAVKVPVRLAAAKHLTGAATAEIVRSLLPPPSPAAGSDLLA